MSYLL